MRIRPYPRAIEWRFVAVATLLSAFIAGGLSLLGITRILDAGTITNLVGSAIGALAAVVSVLVAVDYATSRDQRQLAYYLHLTSCDLWNELFLLNQTLVEVGNFGEPVSQIDAARIAYAASEVEKALARAQRNLDRVAGNFFRLDYIRVINIGSLEELIEKAPRKLEKIKRWTVGQRSQELLPTKFQADVEDMLKLNVEINEHFVK